jgi:hypothetical protein
MSVLKTSFVALLLLFAANIVLAQSGSDTLLAKDNVMIPLPTISVNFGISNSFSDVKIGSTDPSAFTQFSYQLTITQRVTKFLSASLNLYTGIIYGEEQIGQTNLNYRTTLFSQHINVEYNFYPFLKPNLQGRQLIRPYVGFGLGVLSFRSKGDLKDDKGRDYQYWTDGSINAEIEGSVTQSEATSLERDFQYETELRDANLDGLRKYSQITFSLPLNAGIRFQISKNVGLNAAFAYSFNFSDMLDNVSADGVGNRQGNSSFDNHLFGSVGLSVFLGTTKPSAKSTPTFDENLIAEEIIENPDSDGTTNLEKEKIDKHNLASISQRLKQASESIIEIAGNSETLLTEKSNELSEITDREILSKKELRAVKRESIIVLDSSISVLKTTEKGLIEATSDLKSAYTDFTDKKFDTRPSSTTKVKKAVEVKVSAIESLKSQVTDAKSADELKAILNITSKNLTHTNDIFKNESARINQSILDSRKVVVEARVEQFKSDVQNIGNEQNDGIISDAGTSSSITTELDKLLEEGVINEIAYNQLTSTTKESEEVILASFAEDKSAKNMSVKDELASTTSVLTAASEAMAEKTEVAKQSLDIYNQQILSLTKQEVTTKRELKEVKQQAIQLIEKSKSALIETNKGLDSVTENLKQANITLPDAEQIDVRFANVDGLQESIEEIIPRLEASRVEIQSTKKSEDLKQLLRSTNLDLTNASDKISEEKSRISIVSEQIIKELATNNEVQKQEIESLNDENNLEKGTANKTGENATTSTELNKSSSNNEDEADLTYEQRLEVISAARNDISKLQERITTQQQEVNLLGTSISKDKKLKKSGFEAVKNLLSAQISTNQEIAALAIDLARLQEDNQVDQSKIESEISASPKLKSKQDAISLLDALKSELANSQTFLIEERTAVKSQQTKLNQLGVVKAKVRLMEKMNTKNEANSSLSESQLEKIATALTAELEELKSDSSLISLLGNDEISTLKERVAVFKSEITSDNIEKEQANASNKNQVPEQTKDEDSSGIRETKPESIAHTVEEIENTPPKKTRGFMWADVNNNGWISPDEVLYFIDLLFEGEAVRNIEDIQNLIDYYFDQE